MSKQANVKPRHGYARALVAAGTIALAMLLPLPVRAQSATSGSISGEVKDDSGGAIPGVTVEVSSPALIERVRAAATDGQGRYTIIDLRPGTYLVTFTLPGFKTVAHEGIDLTTGFSARVDALMQLGGVEERLTVVGGSPVVDTRNVAARTVVTRQVLDALPTAQNFAALGALTLGATSPRDVAGSAGDRAGTMAIHGSRTDGIATFDGLSTHSLLGLGARRTHPNQLAISEMNVATSSQGAEAETGGVAVNIVPKEGGNRMTVTSNVEYTGKRLQNGNFSDALRARGLSRSSEAKYLYTAGVGVGGPIIQDRLWFYTAPTRRGAQSELAGLYYNKAQGTLFYEPDLDRPAYTDFPVREWINLRLTWQATAKQKVAFTAIDQNSPNNRVVMGPSRVPEAAIDIDFRQVLLQPSWTYPASDRLLFEARGVWHSDGGPTIPVQGAGPGDRPVQDLGLGIWYGSHVNGGNPDLRGATSTTGFLADYGPQTMHYVNTRFAANYVTGSHTATVGVTSQNGMMTYGPSAPFFDEAYQFRNQVPVGLFQIAGPGYAKYKFKANMAVFAQDQWTLGRVSFNLGGRLDYINAYSPEYTRPAGTYAQEYHFARINKVPEWLDISPRIGVAYDLFGDGKTAIKANLGKYYSPVGFSIVQRVSPGEAIAGTVFRTWNDTNSNYVPDCNLHSVVANGECGAMANQAFGQPIPTRTYDPDYLTGSGNREYMWQGSVSVQHELFRGVALDVGYYRTSFGNATVVDNLAVTPSDYDAFCITAPTDARLPGGGGNQICGLYDLQPAKFGAVNEQVTLGRNFGKMTEIFNGVDVGVKAQLSGQASVFGGVSSGKKVTDDCDVIVDSPQKRFCRKVDPQTQVKFAGFYRLPWWGIETSAVYQNLPGIDRLSTFVATNAMIAPSLGRNLGQCGAAATCNATVIVDLVESGTEREKRQNQLDVRLGVRFGTGGLTLRPSLDIYNITNANDVQSMNTRYGATWLNATAILPGRTFKFGLRTDF